MKNKFITRMLALALVAVMGLGFVIPYVSADEAKDGVVTTTSPAVGTEKPDNVVDSAEKPDNVVDAEKDDTVDAENPDEVVDGEVVDGETEAPDVAEPVEMTETQTILSKFFEKLNLEMMMVETNVVPADRFEYFTGLADNTHVADAAVTESMTGSVPFSMVLVKALDKNDANYVSPEDLAEQMKAGIDTRKWICVEADDMNVSVNGDYAFLFMIGSDFDENVTSEKITKDFKDADLNELAGKPETQPETQPETKPETEDKDDVKPEKEDNDKKSNLPIVMCAVVGVVIVIAIVAACTTGKKKKDNE